MSRSRIRTLVLCCVIAGGAALPGARADAQAVTRRDTIKVLHAPMVMKVGVAAAEAPVAKVMRGGVPVPYARLQIVVMGTDARAVHGSAVADSAGVAIFRGLIVYGSPGSRSLLVQAAGSDAEPVVLPVEIQQGDAAALLIIRAPSMRIVPDSPLAQQPVVRVVDENENPIPGTEIIAQVCKQPVLRGDSTRAPQSDCGDTVSAELHGKTVVKADEHGEATYTDLAIVGPGGDYRLMFRPLGPYAREAWTYSGVLAYRPGDLSTRSHVVISAIKSITGEVRRDEFFDVRFRFRYDERIFGLANFDVALSSPDDTAGTAPQLLTEAGASLNYTFRFARDPITHLYERGLFVGAVGRIFNTLPYWGVQAGSVEYRGSAFQGSSFAVALLVRMRDSMSVIGSDTIRASPLSVGVDAFLRSSTIAFFKTLNLRIGVLIPVRQAAKIQSRITIAVPVGTLEFF